MKFVIQRVSHASVTVDNNMIGKINRGFLVLIGIGSEDTKGSGSSDTQNVWFTYL